MFIYVNGQDITTNFYGTTNYNSTDFGKMDVGRENDTLIISMNSGKLHIHIICDRVVFKMMSCL